MEVLHQCQACKGVNTAPAVGVPPLRHGCVGFHTASAPEYLPCAHMKQLIQAPQPGVGPPERPLDDMSQRRFHICFVRKLGQPGFVRMRSARFLRIAAFAALAVHALCTPVASTTSEHRLRGLRAADGCTWLNGVPNCNDSKQSTSPAWFNYTGDVPVLHAGVPYRDNFQEVVLSASFPRSGSTWMYRLLEQATGVQGCAGECACVSAVQLVPLTESPVTDYALLVVYDETRNRHFLGGWQADDVFALTRTGFSTRRLSVMDNCVTKTHYPFFDHDVDRRVKPTRLLLLLRNPVDAVLSMRDYESKQATRSSPFGTQVSTDALIKLAERYQCVPLPRWPCCVTCPFSPPFDLPLSASFRRRWVSYWSDFVKRLNSESAEMGVTVPVLVVKYEEMCENTVGAVTDIMAFAGLSQRRDSLFPITNSTCVGYSGKNLVTISTQQFDEIVRVTAPIIDEFGYKDLVNHQRVLVQALSSSVDFGTASDLLNAVYRGELSATAYRHRLLSNRP